MKTTLFIVTGPTGSGKTELAISLAKEKNGELINADSRQIYKYLSIGTNVGDIKKTGEYELSLKSNNKINAINRFRKAGSQNCIKSGRKISERDECTLILPLHSISNVPIHLIQFLDPDEKFDVFSFKELAEALIKDISNRGKTPILIGGTGLYIDAIVKGYVFKESEKKDLENSRKTLETKTISQLQKLIPKEIFETLNRSDRNNPRRLLRVIEKKTHKELPKDKSFIKNFNIKYTFPEYDWKVLKEKINNRVEEMFKEGLIEEVKAVLLLGFPKDAIALQGTGFKEVIKYLEGEYSLEKCIELVKASHRQYARRQRTWIRNKLLNKL